MSNDAIISLITSMIAPFIIAFCAVQFGIKKQHLKKHGKPMSVGSIIGWTLGIGVILLVIAFMGMMG